LEVNVLLESNIIFQIEKCGWSASPIPEGWYLQHLQSHQVAFLRFSQHWLCLSSSQQEQCQTIPQDTLAERVAFLRHLMQRNERMFMAKYSLDKDNLPHLMVELPLKDLSFVQLSRALDSLSQYAAIGEVLSQSDANLLPSVPRVPADTLTEMHGPDIEAGISKASFVRYMRGLDGWIIKEELHAFPWHIGYINFLRYFDVYCTISRNWFSLQVSLLVDQIRTVLQANLPEQAFCMEYLLRLNNLWFLAKTGIDVHNQILLLVELPTEAFDFPLLRIVTRTIAAYLDSYSQEIQIMASLQQDSRLLELLRPSVC
jgi:hypothetical protein